MDEQEKQAQQAQEDNLKHWWHPPFYQGLIAVLDPTEKALVFQDEHRLSKEALRIDVLVTTNDSDIPENHALVKMFKKHNIFEYKAHNDSLTKEDYVISVGKGHIYSGFKKVKMSEITVTFAVSKFPRTVMEYLTEERNFTVKDKGNGLHYIHGDVFPIQILVCRKNDNIILKNLHDKLTPTEVYETIHAFETLRPGEKNVYVEKIIQANWNAYKEASKMYPTLKERLSEVEKEGWFDERDLEKAKVMARKMLIFGDSVEKIAEVTELPLDMVKTLV